MSIPRGPGLKQRFSQIAAPLTSMLKTSGSTESTTRPEKGGVRVGGDGGENGGYDDVGGCSCDFDRKFHPRLRYNSRTTHLDTPDELINGLIH